MINSIFSGQTAFLVFQNLVLLFLAYIVMAPSIKEPCKVSKGRLFFGLLLCFLFCMFSFWGADWFGYIYEIGIIQDYGASNSNLESFYVWIVENVTDNYLLFRAIIWGGALILLLLTLERLSIKFDLAILLFSTVWIIWFSYARVSLAMAMMFYGAAICYRPYKNLKLLSLLLGLTAIICSFFMHKSSLFGIAVLFLSFFTSKNSKTSLILCLLAFPLFIFLAQYYVDSFSSMDFSDDGSELTSYMEAGVKHMNRATGRGGLGTLIQKTLEHIPYYLLAIFSLKSLNPRTYTSLPKDIKLFVRILFFIVLFASIFVFNLGTNTNVLYSRFMRFAGIPATIVLSYFIENHLFERWPKRIYYIALAGSFYSVIYMMYNAYVG